jgi:long-subunit fatty acid transport protein
MGAGLLGKRVGVALAVGSTTLLVSAAASANGFEIPENGTELMGRAGAWTARADNPLAAAYNPAGLAGQPSALLLNTNLTWQSFCFQRAGVYGDPGSGTSGTVFERTDSYAGQAYPEVCKDNGLKDVNPVPQLAYAYSVTDKLGVAFAVITPSGTGKAKWPDQVNTANGAPAPAPQRYMLLEQNGIVVTPTLAAGYEVVKGLRFGVGFQAVISYLKFSNASHAYAARADDVNESPYPDLRGTLTLKKYFTPAVVLGALASATPDFDIGGMFRWGADIVIKDGDVTIQGPMYGRAKTAADTPAETKVKVQEFRLPQPMEARLGFRYHPMRPGATPKATGRRDFLEHDLYDVELDVTYAHDSAFQDLKLLFPADQHVALGSTSNAGIIPPDASVPHRWKDTIGVRLGGEYVVLPSKLGVRAGAFYQTSGQDPAYLSIDFLPSAMFGGYLGGTYRVSTAVDLSLGYGHVFLVGLDNGGKGQLYGLNAQPNWDAGICPTTPAPAQYRSCVPVNSGKVTGHYDMFSLGATFRF